MWVHITIVALVAAIFLGRLTHVLLKRRQRPTA